LQGPLLQDELIVGFHAKTPEEFASALDEALSLSSKQQVLMRKAARNLAVQTFSEERFNKGWEKGWKVVESKSLARRKRKAAEDALD
jgi:glycosyltransferase involved in cell wall biosynthesis